MKTSVLAVVIASVPFLFYFHILVHTGHANFDFKESCFSFEKGSNGQNYSSGPTTP